MAVIREMYAVAVPGRFLTPGICSFTGSIPARIVIIFAAVVPAVNFFNTIGSTYCTRAVSINKEITQFCIACTIRAEAADAAVKGHCGQMENWFAGIVAHGFKGRIKAH
jgi:hypothetical protein